MESFDGSIWEPACGEGAIAQVLVAAGHLVVSTDLHGYDFGRAPVDFLQETAPRAKHIVTNPPYGSGLADAFILKALGLTTNTGGKIAMLLNLASLCHPSRTAFWRQHPPARIYAIDGVVCWPEHLYGTAPTAFRRHRYCWVVGIRRAPALPNSAGFPPRHSSSRTDGSSLIGAGCIPAHTPGVA